MAVRYICDRCDTVSSKEMGQVKVTNPWYMLCTDCMKNYHKLSEGLYAQIKPQLERFITEYEEEKNGS